MNKLIALICLLPMAAFGQGFGYVGMVANRTNGELLTPTNFINSFVGGSNVVIVPTNNGVGWKLIINAASSVGGGGVDGSANSNLSYSIGAAATNFTLAASNAVRLVSGLDATNHGNAQLQSATNYANGVTNSSIVRQTELTAASNAVVAYADGVTNSSIVRQLELTAASNSLVTYANSVTNSSIVRQAELTAASNALLSVTYTVGANLTNYANGVTNSSIVRQTELTAASNALVTFAISTTNSSIVRQIELTAASNAVLATTYTVGANLTNYANGVTNSSIVRQADLTAASNALLAVTYTVGANGTNYANGVTNSSIVRQADLAAASNVLATVTALQLDLIATNGSANSNLIISVAVPYRDIFFTNSITITNWTALTSGTVSNFVYFLHPMLINRTVVYPTLGGSSFGICTFTNANSPMWTTLTQGVTYALSGTTRGTNVHLSISEWK